MLAIPGFLLYLGCRGSIAFSIELSRDSRLISQAVEQYRLPAS